MDATNNPYKPPAARVEDLADARLTPRPRLVSVALGLLWSSMAVEVLDKVLDAREGLQRGETVVLASNSTLVLVGLVCVLIFLIGRRKNWARITYAVLLSMALVANLAGWQSTLDGPPRELVTMLLQLGLQLAAMVLVFQRAANAWFRPKPVKLGPDPIF